MAKFKQGQTITFKTVHLTLNNVPIESVVEKQKGIDGKIFSQPQLYIIEHANGWKPNSIRKSKYGLDTNKKYLFVQENQLNLQNI